MKNNRETYVRKAEIAQLILLHQLYSLSGSRELIFQGGTALRWCYGGSRFSEDLDFVTPLGADEVFHAPEVFYGRQPLDNDLMHGHFLAPWSRLMLKGGLPLRDDYLDSTGDGGAV